MTRNITFFPVIIMMLYCLKAAGQQFDMAHSYPVTNSNEVAALTSDASNNAFISGVYDASPFLPYTGNCYLMKANSEGTLLWTRYFTGQVQIGDMVVSGDGLFIAGQANGVFEYDGIAYGLPAYHMFLMKTDSDGNLLWIKTDGARNGAGANLAAGNNGQVAVKLKGISNIGNYIELIDSEGNVVKSKEISGNSTSITDLAFHSERVYLNGAFNGSDSLVVDDIVIHQPAIEHAAFVLALDSNFIAAWASTDTSINNRDGRIVAGDAGVYAYLPVLEPPFTTVNVIKRFTHDGQLIREAVIPFFTTAVTLYPDMAMAPGVIGIYANNDFNHDDHEVILFDENLDLIDELRVTGQSDLYSGQIAASSDGFVVSHVHSGALNFNNAFTLPYSGSGKKPYIGRLSLSEPTGLSAIQTYKEMVSLYPNPVSHTIFAELEGSGNEPVQLLISDASGRMVQAILLNAGTNAIDVSSLRKGLYFGSVLFSGNRIVREKLIVR